MSDFFSAGWSVYIAVATVAGLLGCLALLIITSRARVDPKNDTGHTWDGDLRELNNPMPRWWVVLFVVTIVFAFAYLALYPGFGNFKGALGWTSQAQLAEQVAANGKRIDEALLRFGSRPPEELAKDADARSMGKTLFNENCSACHGRDARGNPLLGAPDLTDNDWLYGGDGAAITASILDGRHGVMPPWGPQFGPEGVENLANYVLGLSGVQHDAAKAEAGKAMFTVCAACHGPDGKGNTVVGAPNLTDGVWLYGGDLASIEATVRSGRNGQMPAWGKTLGPDRVRLVAAWVLAQSKASDAVPKERTTP